MGGRHAVDRSPVEAVPDHPEVAFEPPVEPPFEQVRHDRIHRRAGRHERDDSIRTYETVVTY